MFAILEGDEYMGFTLLGEEYILYDGKDFYAPESSASIAEQVAAMSGHAAAVEKICTMISKLALKETDADGKEKKEEVDKRKITTSGLLVEEIVKRKFSKEAKAEFAEISRHLKFQEDFYPNTPDRLLWLLQYLTKDYSVQLDPKVPQYIPANVDLLDDRVFRVLCAFGPDAPSFQNTSGKDHFALGRVAADGDGPLKLGDKVEIPPKLHVAMKSVAVATADWKKMVKDKQIKMDFKERAGKNRYMVVNKAENVKAIFFGLCVLATFGIGPRGEKRKAADEDEMDESPDKGPLAKRVRLEDEAGIMGALEDMSEFL